MADDLARAAAATACAALAQQPGADGAGAVGSFLAQRPVTARRYQALARSVVPGGPVNFSLVALALRALAHLAQSGPDPSAPGEAPARAASD
jgi:hypothetical protein